MPRYMEQLERAKRYHRRFSDIIHNYPSVTLSDKTCGDIVRSCFVHIHHIRDWVENDNSSDFDLSTRSICQFYKDDQDATDILRTCREVCNGIKHLKFPEFGEDVVMDIEDGLNGTSSSQRRIAGYRIVHKGTKPDDDAFCLATRAIGLWENFISKSRQL